MEEESRKKEGRRKKEEERRKKEGRRKKEEGRRKKKKKSLFKIKSDGFRKDLLFPTGSLLWLLSRIFTYVPLLS